MFKKLSFKLNLISLVIASTLSANLYAESVEAPKGPQGPQGATTKTMTADLISGQGLKNLGDYGAFISIIDSRPPNNEREKYYHKNVTGDRSKITLTAEKEGKTITSGRMNTYDTWSTQSNNLEKRGYIEVRALLPAKPNGISEFQGAWPAIWMLPKNYRGSGWPSHGEIDIMEMINGNPTEIMSLHSTNHHGANAQHPPEDP